MTVYKVHDSWENKRLELASIEAAKVKNGYRLANRVSAWHYRVIVSDAHESPEAAINAFVEQAARRLANATQAVLDADKALQRAVQFKEATLPHPGGEAK